jgi:DNA-binding winged helix-turn-helix (wHTH) protein
VALYQFGLFVLDTPERRVTRQGERLPVTGKRLDVLRLLVEAEGRLVDRQTFNAQLWPEVIVEDRNLTVHISALRKALGGEYIETVAKSGYRLAVPVRAMNGRASSESQQVLREARYQLSQAERVPALRALGLFERALALDGNDAGALSGLASTYLLLSSTTIRRPLPVDEAVQLAADAARRAITIDERQGEAYAVLGRLKMAYDWDWQDAEPISCARWRWRPNRWKPRWATAVSCRRSVGIARRSPRSIGRATSVRHGARRTNGWGLPGGWQAMASGRCSRSPTQSPSTPRRDDRTSDAWWCSISSDATRRQAGSGRAG